MALSEAFGSRNVSPRAPSVSHSRSAAVPVREWRFVVAALVACLGSLGIVFTLNVVVDPFAIAGTQIAPSAVETDRAVKLTLIQQLSAAPDILVLGSSRARQAQPSFLSGLTGHGGFNAGVTGGTAADAWVFTRYTADRFPGTTRRYIWFVDVGIAVKGINPQLASDPRASRYLEGGGMGFGLSDVGAYLGFDATRASLRVLDKCVLHACQTRITYEPDGSIPGRVLGRLPEQTKNVDAAAAALVASIRADPPGRPSADRARYAFFERTLAFMNSRGERPVLVFNPIYPTVLAELERHGFPARAASLEYLARLHRRFDFVVVDCQDIRAWGGKPDGFMNATHVNSRSMQQMLRFIVAHSDGALS